MIRITILWLITLMTFAILKAQSSTSLYLVDFQISDQGNWNIENVTFASGFNPKGYNNQPWFINEQELLISAANSDSLNAADLYLLNIEQQEVRRITHTSEREYSPSLGPDGVSVECVLVDSSGNQLLWSFPIDRDGGGRQIGTKLKNVGYYARLSEELIAEFRVEDPVKLFINNLNTEQSRFLSSKIGRCLKKDPNGNLVYLHQYSDNYWFLKKYDPESGQTEIIKKAIPDAIDFIILPSGEILTSVGSKLYLLESGTNNWVEVMDLEKYDLYKISRIDYNGKNTLAVVVDNE